jgi:hypothetical protein
VIAVTIVFPEVWQPYYGHLGGSDHYYPAIQIKSIVRDADCVVTVNVQNVGGVDVVLSNVYVNGVSNIPVTPLPIDLNETETASIVLSGIYTDSQIKVKVETEDGTVMEITKKFTG